jgi:simple sugar transport system ATP-binding protein
LRGLGVPAARLHEISKAFVAGVPVLDRVSLEVAPGEVLALLGENGAGKSTLMNVLAGLVRPDAGGLELAGERIELARWGPRGARAHGVGMVHQHSALVPALTVAENLGFGEAGLWFRPGAELRAAEALSHRFELEVPVARRVEELSPGQRQRAEILRALGRGARLLILDEPTAVLTPGESGALFAAVKRLRDAGRAVIFISHKLAEVEQVADRVAILRRGRVVADLAAGEQAAEGGAQRAEGERRRAPAKFDARELGRLMLGRDLPPLERRAAVPGAIRLALRGLSVPGITERSRLRGLDLELRAGEIVGAVGIDGNGQRELEEALAGVRRPSAGQVELDGRRVPLSPRALRRAGLAHLSGDRERAGLVRGMSLTENFILKGSWDDRRFFRSGRIDRRAAARATAEAATRFGVTPGEPERDISSLSGGNAQKLAVARELDGDPAVLVAVNPTRGLDVGSARFVHEQLLARRAAGGAVLLISSELDEVLALADRVVALVRGELRAVPPGADRAAIGAILLGDA